MFPCIIFFLNTHQSEIHTALSLLHSTARISWQSAKNGGRLKIALFDS
jgi:hypothetical protein